MEKFNPFLAHFFASLSPVRSSHAIGKKRSVKMIWTRQHGADRVALGEQSPKATRSSFID